MRRALRAAAVTAMLAVLPATAQAAVPHAQIAGSPAVAGTSATIDFSATGPALLAQFTCRLDQSAWQRCTSPVRYDDLAAGVHSFAVRLEGIGADPTPAVTELTAVVPQIAPVPVPVLPVVAPSQRSPCPGSTATPATMSSARLASTLLCLLNADRRRRGLRGLRADERLRRAAAGHALDMLRNRFFGHRSSNGRGLAWRTRGYTRDARRWEVSEALHWGEGRRASPGDALEELLASPHHRAILLARDVRDIGIAAVTYVRRDSGRLAATYVLDLGRRT